MRYLIGFILLLLTVSAAHPGPDLDPNNCNRFIDESNQESCDL